MPGRDGTGPASQGYGAGMGAGKGFAGRRQESRGRGGRFCYRNWSPDDLKFQREALQRRLDALDQEIREKGE